MRTMLTVICALVLVSTGAAAARPQAAARTAAAHAPSLPDAWGPAYEMEYELEMPYLLQLQPGGLKYRAHVWIDHAAHSERVDYGDGLQRSYFIGDKEYSIAPRKYEKASCRVFDDPGKGPVLSSSAASRVAGAAASSGGVPAAAPSLRAPALPDLSAGGWVHAGAAAVGGRPAELWQRKDIKGQKISSYAFYVSEDGTPLRLHAVGVDILEGSHYDEYSYTFLSFRRGAIDPQVFAVPSICNQTDVAVPVAPISAPRRQWDRRHGRVAAATPRRPAATFKATMTKEQLPRFFDWRGTPADVAVKDQAQCGSCWAFSATGSMEGAWFVHTGASRSFSEQQLIDCAWDEGGHGCDGGDVRSAFDYVTAAGGAATTAEYPLTGMVGVCRDNSTKLEGVFDGFVRVDQDDVSVMEALMKHGPLSIGIDADYDFGAYSEGVYHEKRCSTRPSRLNHAVVLVGWGEREGRPYWIVRNTWSSLWGQDGYIFMHRDGNDCGVASDAVFVKVAAKHVVPGAQARASALGVARGRELEEQEERRAAAVRAAAAAAAAAAGGVAAS